METTHEIKIIPVDYNSNEMPDAVRNYKPIVLNDGHEYCCFLGERPEYGIYGCGDTADEAIMHWNQKYLQKTVEGALFSTKKPILEGSDDVVRAYFYRGLSI
ncbi:hypothetical protein L3C95_28715 [Chitinophaga filiformis]|uniref:hypothetical protein n=1 Tax=Chitinophaga filiformis TaxID=104663 RepID=UPI001F1D484E|nr:hypothetical protein [Chitinophaga filiformis]MCF6406916.1 hypothetical protein [Chitinophaga filiformis]